MLDRAKLRFAIYGHLIEAKVRTKAERREKAITKGALTKLVIPDTDDDATDEIGRKVYEELIRTVWNENKPNHSGFIQDLVGDLTDEKGRAYVLIRAKVSVKGNPLDAVYITTDYERISDDFTSPLGAAVTRAAKKYAANAAMLIERGQEQEGPQGPRCGHADRDDTRDLHHRLRASPRRRRVAADLGPGIRPRPLRCWRHT